MQHSSNRTAPPYGCSIEHDCTLVLVNELSLRCYPWAHGMLQPMVTSMLPTWQLQKQSEKCTQLDRAKTDLEAQQGESQRQELPSHVWSRDASLYFPNLCQVLALKQQVKRLVTRVSRCKLNARVVLTQARTGNRLSSRTVKRPGNEYKLNN